jgi:heme/copper-type cytochrome/quinol oxidase subunit 2
MTRSMSWKEPVGVLAVVLVLVGLPGLLWYWRAVALPHRYPPGTKIITLTAVADGGIWTQDEVVGSNYWRRKPARTEQLTLNQGDHVVMRLRSVDVLHSFAIPLLRLGPVDVPAGHTVEVKFNAERAGVLTFLCWQVCSPDHPGLHGRFLVKGNGPEKSEAEEGW